MPSQKPSYNQPSYHWAGFGRSSTVPPWYDPTVADKDRRPPPVWHAGAPPEKLPSNYAPFVYSMDKSSFRPTVTRFTTDYPASPRSRMLLSRGNDGKEVGAGERSKGMTREYAETRRIMQANKTTSRTSVVKEILQSYAGVPCTDAMQTMMVPRAHAEGAHQGPTSRGSRCRTGSARSSLESNQPLSSTGSPMASRSTSPWL
ncbi:unnamed protein product [Chrysoparadoxa australica]